MCLHCNKEYSQVLGMVPDELSSKKVFPAFKYYGMKIESPSELEIELSQRKHRWSEMNNTLDKFFKATAKTIVGAEIDSLKVFGLPNIDEIRKSFDPDFIEPKLPLLTFTSKQFDAHKRVTEEIQQVFIGDSKLKLKQYNMTNLSIFDYYLLESFGISAKHVFEDLKKELPPNLDTDDFERTVILPQIENQYLRATIKEAGKKIKTQLAQKHFTELKDNLIQMAKEGKSPYQIGRLLHKSTGEGELWYWNRITRSEAILACNAGFKAQGEAAGCEFEEWSAAANACPICQAFHGRMWKFGEGPEPVSDSHPHCLCHKIARYIQGQRPVQDSWDEPSPYDQSYTSDELANLPGRDDVTTGISRP